jgi:cell division protein FtsZ
VNVDFADVRTVMQEGGSALMGTGVGRGENRAIEAAQQAIASPLLDNVSVSGATGVLVNITGGADLTLGEVHQINEIIHDAVGEDAEIIFGAVHEPAMQGEIRVTVIATGFDRMPTASSQPQPTIATPSPIVRGAPVIPLRPSRGNGLTRTPLGEIPRRITPTSNPIVTPERDRSSPEQDLSDMEIPTFIRRQMD